MKGERSVKKRSGRVISAAIFLLLFILISSSACGGHKLPEPSADISGVSKTDVQNAEKVVIVRRADGKTDQVPMDPEDAARSLALAIVVDGIPYVSYGEGFVQYEAAVSRLFYLSNTFRSRK